MFRVDIISAWTVTQTRKYKSKQIKKYHQIKRVGKSMHVLYAVKIRKEIGYLKMLSLMKQQPFTKNLIKLRIWYIDSSLEMDEYSYLIGIINIFSI